MREKRTPQTSKIQLKTQPYNKRFINHACSVSTGKISDLGLFCTDLAALGTYCPDLGLIFFPYRPRARLITLYYDIESKIPINKGIINQLRFNVQDRNGNPINVSKILLECYLM